MWVPGFYAGEVRAELLDRDDRALGTWRLDVSPDAGKAGRDLFERMINEIVDFDARLVVGEEPARRRLGALGETEDPLVWLERLRRRRKRTESGARRDSARAGECIERRGGDSSHSGTRGVPI